MTTIYMPLLDEGVVVWRPIEAEQVSGNVYRVPPKTENQSDEHWQFAPGEKVVCEMVDSSVGKILAATKRIE